MEKPIPTGIVLISAIFFFIITMLLSSMAVEAGSGSTTSGVQELGLYYFPAAKASSSWCNGGSIEECMMKMRDGDDDEDDGLELEMMDSESNRRIMYGRRRYISYGALYRDRVPCSRRGYSYYNCRPGRPVNPYVRGCNAITRCRSF